MAIRIHRKVQDVKVRADRDADGNAVTFVLNKVSCISKVKRLPFQQQRNFIFKLTIRCHMKVSNQARLWADSFFTVILEWQITKITPPVSITWRLWGPVSFAPFAGGQALDQHADCCPWLDIRKKSMLCKSCRSMWNFIHLLDEFYDCFFPISMKKTKRKKTRKKEREKEKKTLQLVYLPTT